MPALPQTTVSGIAYDEQGNVAPGVRLRVVKAIKSGQVIKLQPRTIATSNASGVFERSTGVADFLLPRNSTVWLSGSFYNGATSFKGDNGISVAIPDAGTATLEGLGAGAVVPVQGVTVQSNGTPTANLISIFNFTTGLTAIESPTGTVTVSSTAVAPAWGVISGTLSAQTDLQNALNLKAPLASPTFTGTVAGVTSAMVGLGNVNNTSDANKPVSTAHQTALDLKANLISPSFTTPTLGVASATSLSTTGGGLDIKLGGATSAFPALKRNSTAVNFRLADDSGDAPITAAKVTSSVGVDTGTVGYYQFGTRGYINTVADGVITLNNNNTNDFGRLNFGGTTSAFAALKRFGAAIALRSAADTVPTFSLLPAASSAGEGALAAVSDSSTATPGATITGGGSNHVLAYCNGTVWKVVV